MVRNDVNIIKLDVRWVKKFYFYVMVFDIFDVYVYWFSKFFLMDVRFVIFFLN